MGYIVNFYQEQPHVLDPHLQGWIDKLLKIGFRTELPKLSTDVAFAYLYLLTKTRGVSKVCLIYISTGLWDQLFPQFYKSSLFSPLYFVFQPELFECVI
eukprot:sb/3478617/